MFRSVLNSESSFRAQRIGQGIGERGQQHTGLGMAAGEEYRPVQRNDGLARARRTGHPRRAAVVPLHPLALRRVEKDRPLLPGILQGALQFLDTVYNSEPALRIGMCERVVHLNWARQAHNIAFPERFMIRGYFVLDLGITD